MRKLVVVGFLLAATCAHAQLSEPHSDQAGNILNGSSSLANQLPAPLTGANTVEGLLTDATRALHSGRTGEAQEALERAESLALDRSVPQSEGNNEITDPMIADIARARGALGMKDIAGALHATQAAQTLAMGS